MDKNPFYLGGGYDPLTHGGLVADTRARATLELSHPLYINATGVGRAQTSGPDGKF